MEPGKLYSWRPAAPQREFKLVVENLPEIREGEALVEVAGCGVCHTDISFWHYGVKTKKEFPLTLGHEISGSVVRGPDHLMGKKVIIPAVLPCGDCELCRNDRGNICQNQVMPGNDFHGGFASHVAIPARFLCPVPDEILVKFPLERLSVVADAISTPYQVIKKAGIRPGDFAIISGVGGIGIYGVIIAKVMGARVLAIDISPDKLKTAAENGADATLLIQEKGIKEIKAEVRTIANSLGVSKYAWKIFEMSGTKSGQELTFNLLTFASTLSIVGFTMDKLEVRLSNLMAMDATLIGTWGCKPELYAEVLQLIGDGHIDPVKFSEIFPMSEINQVFGNTLDHLYTKRSILIPDFKTT